MLHNIMKSPNNDPYILASYMYDKVDISHQF